VDNLWTPCSRDPPSRCCAERCPPWLRSTGRGPRFSRRACGRR